MRNIKDTECVLEQLPMVKGRYSKNTSLARYSWFRTGGLAEILYTPTDLDELSTFMHRKPRNIPITVLGVGSNVLIRDGGIKGVVIRLGKSFNSIRVAGDCIYATGGALDISVSAMARDENLSGLEFLSGIPGTIGGALRMNAGAYGREMSDIVMYAIVLDDSGRQHKLLSNELDFCYRSAKIPNNWIIVEVAMKGKPDTKASIVSRIEKIRQYREGTQPMRTKTGGSTFRNPECNLSNGRKAWQLIEEAGCRGMKYGGAKVSDKHCNFLINTGNASSHDLEMLATEIQKIVKEKSGILLDWEIKCIGVSGDNCNGEILS